MTSKKIVSGYHLAEACENTFLIFDCLKLVKADENFLTKAHIALIKENRDDALILIDGHERDNKFYARMLVLGADGLLGEFCGNGSRACAAYLFSTYPQYKAFYLMTEQGPCELSRCFGIYSTHLPLASLDVKNTKFIAFPSHFKKEDGFYFFALNGNLMCYVETIEPHLILQEKISNEELIAIGDDLNRRRDVFKFGININLYEKINLNEIRVTTYERGVRRLTRSCGTGSVACSLFHSHRSNKKKIKVITPGGILDITIKKSGFILSGPASIG